MWIRSACTSDEVFNGDHYRFQYSNLHYLTLFRQQKEFLIWKSIFLRAFQVSRWEQMTFLQGIGYEYLKLIWLNPISHEYDHYTRSAVANTQYSHYYLARLYPFFHCRIILSISFYSMWCLVGRKRFSWELVFRHCRKPAPPRGLKAW